ncbi:NADH dehydrogenase [Variovorax sp. PBS-H4]|uniref:nitroreductase n=1 Tax=Variovorax sp. PBS-H4 TaxID=434008 RepID=UPI001315D37F|nr:nitroreductase [Variovorax sp. PBS-H4]VTU27305.1 NADH dehydrogenase [Variovorax sp. PBS-H4]
MLTAALGNDGVQPVGAALEAIASRRSIRAFRPDPVPRATIEQLLTLAGMAPSGSNIQPWNVHVVQGTKRRELSRVLLEAHDGGAEARPEYHYYPKVWRAPFLERRRKTGWLLYESLGIARGDREAAHAYRGTNYNFFGAPLGLIVTMGRDMEHGSWIDIGAFVQTLMIAARAFGLHTCAQAAFSNYGNLVRRTLGLDDNELVVCGVSIGHADLDHPANLARTPRAEIGCFTTFHWDEE